MFTYNYGQVRSLLMNTFLNLPPIHEYMAQSDRCMEIKILGKSGSKEKKIESKCNTNSIYTHVSCMFTGLGPNKKNMQIEKPIWEVCMEMYKLFL
jgi:hypothetical protein